MPHPRSRRAPASLIVAAILLPVALAGCSGSAADSSSTAGSAAKADQGNGAGAAPAARVPANDPAFDAKAPEKQAAEQQPNKQPGQDPTPVGPSTRSIVYTGTITVRVPRTEDVGNKANAAAAIATGANGVVAADQRQNDGSRSEARVVLRVPAARFQSTMDALHDLGKEESRSVDTQDVTEQVVDLEVRVANGQASVDRVRALMARAQTIGEIVSLESELSRREADLESLKARKSKLDDLAALSTITAVLLGPDAKAPASRSSATGFLAGLRAGWHSFAASAGVALTVIGALLPWLLVLGVPVVLAYWIVRRQRRRTRSVVVAEPAPAPES